MHLAEIFLLSSKCWQSLIIKIVVVAIVCQNIPWRCRTESSGIAASIYRSSRGKVGREENMHINDNAPLFVHAGNDDIQNSVMIISQTDLQDYPIVLLYLWKKKCRETKKSRNALEMANAETYGGIVSVRREKNTAHFSPVLNVFFFFLNRKEEGSEPGKKKKVEINPMRYAQQIEQILRLPR